MQRMFAHIGSHGEKHMIHRGLKHAGQSPSGINSHWERHKIHQRGNIHMARHCGKRSSHRVRLRKGESPAESRSLKRKKRSSAFQYRTVDFGQVVDLKRDLLKASGISV